ncbi:hypothetical protein A0J61_09710 [Choanephora cucurbitarum]|uniref:Uncharacterized protein n=1 Tax=Choanephora cucurbitarum TaxID=101091 RepID=A0A1C7MZJ6_9FUNG|nr:hypothetical protein A0J61_09710 [Choanephora cucurbitarum]
MLPDQFKDFYIEGSHQGSRKFFSENPASQWDIYNYFELTHNSMNKRKHFSCVVSDYVHDLEWISSIEGLPDDVKRYVLELKEKRKPTKSEMKSYRAKPRNNIIINMQGAIFANNNSRIVQNNYSCKRKANQMEEDESEDELEDELENESVDEMKQEEKGNTAAEKNQDNSLWFDWIAFLHNAKDLHPYSLESHNVIRCGKSVSPRPFLNRRIYKAHINQHEATNSTPVLSKNLINYVSNVIDCDDLKEFRKSIRKLPICNQDEEPTLDLLEEILKSVHTIYIAKQNLCDGETTFNDFLLYPFLRAVCFSVANFVADSNLEFKVGEAMLCSMGKLLKHSSNNDSCCYKADGIIKMFGFKEIEVALLETSSHFRNQDKTKHSFDHHKGTYGVLAMLKGIADEYHLASVDTFSKLKILFVHAADDKVFLWSIRFVNAFSLFEMWQEKSLQVNPSPEAKAAFVPECIAFYLHLKTELEKTVTCISTLKLEHEEQLKKNMFRPTSSITSLKQIVNPSILKLIEEDDKIGMAELGPFYSNPHSPDN